MKFALTFATSPRKMTRVTVANARLDSFADREALDRWLVTKAVKKLWPSTGSWTEGSSPRSGELTIKPVNQPHFKGRRFVSPGRYSMTVQIVEVHGYEG